MLLHARRLVPILFLSSFSFASGIYNPSSGGGGGGTSTLAISSGSATKSVVISSPTSNVVFDSNTINVALQGTTTSFISLTSSVTKQGVITAASLGALTGNQTITLSQDSTGSGATAITVTAAANQPNINTLSASSITTTGNLQINGWDLHKGSMSVQGAGGVGVSFGVAATTAVLTTPLNSGTTTLIVNQNDTNSTVDGVAVQNAGQQNAVQIIQTANVSKSFINGGALNVLNGLDPTNPTGHGAFMVFYDSDSAPIDNMVNIRQDAVAFSSNVVYVSGISSAPLVTINFSGFEPDGAKGGALNITSNNPNYSAVSISGGEGAPDGFGTMKISHTSSTIMGAPFDDTNASVLSMDLLGTGTKAQGIFLKSSASGGTTGKLVNIRNPNTERFVIRYGGDVNISASTSTSIYQLFMSTTPGLTQDNVTVAFSTNAEMVVNGSTGAAYMYMGSQGSGSPIKWTAPASTSGIITNNYTTKASDLVILASAPATGLTVTLNYSTSSVGQTLEIAKVDNDSYTVKVITQGGDLIEGTTRLLLLNGYMQKVELASYGMINSSGAWNEHGGGIQYTPLVVQPAPGAIASSGNVGASSSTYCMGISVPSPIFVKSLDYVSNTQAGNIDIGILDSTGTFIVKKGNTAMGVPGTVAVAMSPHVGLARGNYFLCLWSSSGTGSATPALFGRYSTYNNTPGCGGPLTVGASSSLPANITMPMTAGNQCFQVWAEVDGGSAM